MTLRTLFIANVKTMWTLDKIYCTETHEKESIVTDENLCMLLKWVSRGPGPISWQVNP